MRIICLIPDNNEAVKYAVKFTFDVKIYSKNRFLSLMGRCCNIEYHILPVEKGILTDADTISSFKTLYSGGGASSTSKVKSFENLWNQLPGD